MAVDHFLTVTEITKYIKRSFDQDEQLQNIWIRGELSNFKRHSRGHMYFTVKDENSRMQAVMFAGNNRFLKFQPENGMKVLLRGDISVYEPYGQYQFYAKEMQPDGIGNLYLAFEKLKEQLSQEGLFSERYKKPIPAVPMEIAIATSPTGAAIRDIVTTLKRRFPIANITLLPVLVQGEEAVPSIANAITQANLAGKFDLLIVGRGGGSIEELWAFNEEVVARAIFESKLPVISAVGHETDFTIADFVADLRAATPTAAAELAVPDLSELNERLKGLEARLTRSVKERFALANQRLYHLQKSYAFRYPVQLVKQKEQDLDRLVERLSRQSHRAIGEHQQKLAQLTKDLQRNHPLELVKQASQKQTELETNLQRLMKDRLKDHNNTFQQLVAKLNVLSPLRVMERGYSLAYTEDGTLVKSTEQVAVGEFVDVRLKDGTLACEVKQIEEKQ
ncbi:exodeoxyribonuclease VII large subunit [Desertibacillus haloalkaliphilus]|uniref:exodeoxyribonuclease VII large subunit n=1 Tax=Desertibacillus haloalkaliphilus TaxID=1328930 RepID=UPI001C271C17|nr:exodeoxyribonuclease VII large subunit [Desertibacillus haloalkaliphilus]MBU8907734.1 exodeoxyribonuclease VII large subunit [Desertibacillus haloalkaliphilus]